MKFSKEDIEQIIGCKLLNWEYEVIVKYIQAFRSNGKIGVLIGRQNKKTKLIDTAIVLNSIIPEKASLKRQQPLKRSNVKAFKPYARESILRRFYLKEICLYV